MEGRSRARPARRLVASVVPVTLGVTIDVPSMLVSTTKVLGRVVSKIALWHSNIFQWRCGHTDCCQTLLLEILTCLEHL